MAALCAAASLCANADEGMWTLYNLPQAVYDQMRQYGFKMTPQELYGGDESLKAAVVNFSGFCSGVVVSPDGLVFTNHHCGFDAIRSHSTVEHDYMLNGFYAKTLEEELPNENMFVSFMVSQEDVTPRVMLTGYEYLSKAKRAEVLDSLQRVLNDSVKKIDSTYHVDLDAFYEGNKFYATTYQDFNDLRLVFAVPKSMGKFGGETDNWMWPRQTCDFSVFRIYANPKTNGPAAYSKDNVPYKPKRWAKVSMDGYKPGDYAMTIGYPGSTSRYLSSYGIRERRDAINEPRAQVRGVKQEVMTKHMRADEAVRIKYDSKFARSANYWKNSIGMNHCIDSIDLINQKRQFEEKIAKWQETSPYCIDKVDFDKMSRIYGERLKLRRANTLLLETFWNSDEMSSRAMSLDEYPHEGNRKNPYIVIPDNSETWDKALDQEVMGVLLKNYREQIGSDEFLPDFYKTIDSRFNGDTYAYAKYLYDNSQVMRSGEKLYVNSKKYRNDLGVQMSNDLLKLYIGIAKKLRATADSIATQERYLCANKIQMEMDQPHYSDANFTMRLSYGQVGGFEQGGNMSSYYTEASSIVDKMKQGEKGVFDYKAEPIMKELLSATDFGAYTDTLTHKMHLCFLTNNDITGGNSGSPMFDGKGQLIGLAFDGNWESLSSDINFDQKSARCIGVDIRYVLYMIDKWGHAERLMKEIGRKF